MKKNKNSNNPETDLYKTLNATDSFINGGTVLVPGETVRIAAEADICVIGGSCTGVFAAIRAARLGAKVVLVERQNRFDGVATCGLVNIWHPLYDIHQTRQVIGGLTEEVLSALHLRGASDDFHEMRHLRFNPEELTLELDRFVYAEKNIKPYLLTQFSRVLLKDPQTIDAVVLENKSGRFAVRAKMFIDASGDAVVSREMGLPLRVVEHAQPPTTCMRLEGWTGLNSEEFKHLCEDYRGEFPDLPCGYSWGTDSPGTSMFMLAGTRVLHCDCSDGDAITAAEMESRRQVRAILDAYRRRYPEKRLALTALPSAMGIREGRHICSIRPVSCREFLAGTEYDDTVGHGTYPVDIHDDTSDKISFMDLCGTKRVYKGGKLVAQERWLPEGKNLPYYNIPFRSCIPKNVKNLLTAGRMLDADRETFGALRVMVNLNQLGEAAGVAAWQLVCSGGNVLDIDFTALRDTLNRGGSKI